MKKIGPWLLIGLIILSPLLGVFSDDIFEKNVGSVPKKFLGNYELESDDPFLDPDQYDYDTISKFKQGVEINSNEIRFFDKKIALIKVTIPRFSSKQNSCEFHYSKNEKIEITLRKNGGIYISESAKTPNSQDGTSWRYFGTYKLKQRN